MRWRGKCAYDGTNFFGWQSQSGGNTIQDFLEARLHVIFKQPVRVHSSGRTDSGVHAKEHVFHFDADWVHSTPELLRALRCGLPAGIQVYDIKRVSDKFHARYSTKGKRYVYRFHRGYAPPMESRYTHSIGDRPVEVKAMQEAAKYLVGEHDFSAFGAAREDNVKDNPNKNIWRVDILARGSKIRLITEGSGYLYKMVRSMAGTLLEVGLGKMEPTRVKEILDSRVRSRLVVTAPSKGLCLEKVYY